MFHAPVIRDLPERALGGGRRRKLAAWGRSSPRLPLYLGLVAVAAALSGCCTTTVSGRVATRFELPHRRPISNAIVTLSGTDARAVSDADGRFVLSEVPCGREARTLHVQAAGFRDTSQVWRTYQGAPSAHVLLSAERETWVREARAAYETGLATLLASKPPETSLRRYHLEYEQGLARLLPLDDAQVVSFREVAKACQKTDLLVLGESHGESIPNKLALLRALRQVDPKRPMVLLHEQLIDGWQATIDRWNAKLPTADSLVKDLVSLRINRLEPNAKQPEQRARQLASKAWLQDTAQILAEARKRGMTVKPLDQLELRRRLVRYTRAETRDWTGWCRVQRERDAHFLTRARACRAKGTLLILVVGEGHTVGKGRFPAKWGGTSPVVVLAASLRIQLELERRPTFDASGAYRLKARTFFLPRRDRYDTSLKKLLRFLAD